MSELEDQINAAMGAASVEVGAEMLEAATNLFGTLGPDLRARLLALIAGPSPATWDDAHSIILNGSVGMGRTLWQAMLRVDPACPTSSASYTPGDTMTPAERWQGYAPDALTVLAAIRWAVSRG